MKTITFALDTPAYCLNAEGCKCFRPEAETTVMWADGEPCVTSTKIICKNSDMCKEFRRQMRSQEMHTAPLVLEEI